MPSRERAADDRDGLPVVSIAIVEGAALHDLDAGSVEVLGRRDTQMRLRNLVGRRSRPIRKGDVRGRQQSAQRQQRDDACRANPWDRADPLVDGVEKANERVAIAVGGRRQRQLQRNGVARR